MSNVRATTKAARRDELLDIAWTVVERDGERVSMEDIAAAAGITRPILYRHFGDVHGLWLAVGERFADHLTAAFAGLGARRGRRLLVAAIDAFTMTIAEHPGTYRYLTRRASPAPDADGEEVRTFTASLAAAVAGYLVGQGTPPEVADLWGHTVVGAIQSAGDRWLDHPALDREQLVELTAELLWNGLTGAR